MKYFSPRYWFKLWVLSAPLFNDKTQGINAKSIDNKKIKDWVSNNTNLQSINQEMSYINSNINYQPYNLNEINQNINPFYQTKLEIINNKHHHEKGRNKNKHKRQSTLKPTRSKTILKLNQTLIIDLNNRQQYRNSFHDIIQSLIRNNILRQTIDLNSLFNPPFHLDEENSIFTLNTENYGYFRLPIEIRGIDAETQQSFSRNLELVFRTDNLYLQGFIIPRYIPHLGETYEYYHFDFRNINMNMQPIAVRDGSVPLLTEIERVNSITLTNISPDYRDLLPTNNNEINWQSVYNSFLRLTNNISIGQEQPLGELAQSLGQVIFVTAEALRFWSISANIFQKLINNNSSIILERNNNNIYYNLLTTWADESIIQSLARDWISNPFNSRSAINVNRYLRPHSREYLRQLLTNIVNLPRNVVANILGNSNVRILLGTFALRSWNCKKLKRSLTNIFWKEKFCALKPQIDKIQGEITILSILDKDLKNNNLKKEDIFVGTTKGLYLVHFVGAVIKGENIDNEVTTITKFGLDNFYVTTNTNEIYFLNTKFINDGNLIGQRLWNAESSNLEKEIKLYYDYNHNNNWNMNLKPDFSIQNNYENKILNLKKINPIDNYEKLEFLGDVAGDDWGVKVQWGSWIYDGKPEHHKPENTCDLSYFMKYRGDRNNKFHDIIENTKDKVSNNKKQYLQSFEDWCLSAHILVKQTFGLTWYWKNENYYIKVLGLQYCNWWASYA
ncbi:hypothetical protein [Spiroplasma endosymbiont of Polydrusus pterygomalis]|uniref:hypothetical protein n=1 Tax=Spiroplasma endosymbiont of Polydrusus pterygomalis TaxID=3139327 RepID=UPI003CCA7DEB